MEKVLLNSRFFSKAEVIFFIFPVVRFEPWTAGLDAEMINSVLIHLTHSLSSLRISTLNLTCTDTLSYAHMHTTREP